MNPLRTRLLKAGRDTKGPILYWMSRDQRVQDNWALIFARQTARERKAPLSVLFCLVPQYLNAAPRSYDFMLRGLEELSLSLAEQGIPFHLLLGDPAKKIPEFIDALRAGVLVTDFDPLRIKRQWKDAVRKRIDIPFHEVDAHNIVPCWLASPKQEFSARTLRAKYGRILDDFLDEFPKQVPSLISRDAGITAIDWEAAGRFARADRSAADVSDVKSGEIAAFGRLRWFLEAKLPRYHQDRNDPALDGQSGLSPYLHFGQISAQRVALAVGKAAAPAEAKAAFIEELIVRRELSDNFCLYNQDYDTVQAFPAWAQATLNRHRSDVRARQYALPQFTAAKTHDDLWNAAQMEMVRTGRMHGYMRMYWAKKILEWSESPEEALRISIALNDRYELDGRDPNGYAGCAWSIGGLHDRPWQERPVFGKIRYMNENGCRRKFDVDKYIEKNRYCKDTDKP
ncbi:MAG: deoxyribodipyrimidine photo-lyase [Syntrophales bacterium]|nr:deoxyribodipyrimidine photo-lyase [Syntrophales bacterium]